MLPSIRLVIQVNTINNPAKYLRIYTYRCCIGTFERPVLVDAFLQFIHTLSPTVYGTPFCEFLSTSDDLVLSRFLRQIREFVC
jgi:hypothetical protein